MATLATGLRARFGRTGLAPAGLHQGVSPPHLRFLLFHAFPSAITMSALSNPILCNLRALELMPRESPNYTITSSMARYESLTCPDCRPKICNRPNNLGSLFRLTLD